MKKYIVYALSALAFTSGCASQMEKLRAGPELTAPGASMTPLQPAAPNRVALARAQAQIPMEEVSSGSLWRSGPSSLFGDRRARTLGDIVTVMIEIDEEAEIRNRTDRTHTASEGVSVPAFFGIPTLASRVLPGGATLDPAIDASSNSSTSGDGNIKRQEKITLRVAATVVDLLPNGHMVISGSQEVRVNSELRDLQVAGIIRPEDISRRNIITYEKIADARVLYGGRGTISSVQQPRYGQRALNGVLPF